MEDEQLKEIVKKLRKINAKISELKLENGYLIEELRKNVMVDDEAKEAESLNRVNTKISNIKVDIRQHIIPKIENEIS